MYKPFLFLFTLAAAMTTHKAYAHGFGERYDLPVPLEYYLAGAGAVVVFSFVIIAMFVRGSYGLNGYWRSNLFRYHQLSVLFQTRSVTFCFKLASVFIFLLIIATGIWGNQNPSSNFSPTFVWVIWWVGMGFFVALVGNIWILLNPWDIIYSWLTGAYRYLNPKFSSDLGYEYPHWLGVWPAFTLFFWFAWLENSYPHSSEPAQITIMIVVYSAITWTGMIIFGKHDWLRYGEAFSVIFGFLARFAPTEVEITNRDYCSECDYNCIDYENRCVNCYQCWEQGTISDRALNLRPHAAGLSSQENIRVDTMALVILMLSTVTFDGFKTTPVWTDIQVSLYTTIDTIFNTNALTVIDTIGLVLFPAIFLLIYILFCSLMKRASDDYLDTLVLARTFVYSLIPIALAYNIAHFFTLLAIHGQLIIPLASDPFGYGWNLLGTADYNINIGLINARFAWLLGVTVIVLGHVIAVYVAHVIALRKIKIPTAALRSQYPMLVLMVIYTVISLWIIAQPIVEHS